MPPQNPEQKRERARGVKRFLAFCLILATLAAIYGYQASAQILPESAEWLRVLSRLSLSIGAGIIATILFTLSFAIIDIILRTRTRLKDKMSLQDPDAN